MMSFQQLFKLGMKRNIPELLTFPGPAINLGSSPTDVFQIPGIMALGRPDWVWPDNKTIPAGSNSIATIHCYHFFEHHTFEHFILLLRECERVMIPGSSVLNFCMPYAGSGLDRECLEHRIHFTEETFDNLFNVSRRKANIDGDWTLRVHFIIIAGIVERNRCIIGQLVRKKT